MYHFKEVILLGQALLLQQELLHKQELRNPAETSASDPAGASDPAEAANCRFVGSLHADDAMSAKIPDSYTTVPLFIVNLQITSQLLGISLASNLK